MRFIKHALIGIALYEAVKYILKNEDFLFGSGAKEAEAIAANRQDFRGKEVDVIAGARQTDQLERMGDHTDHDLRVGTDPETPLAGQVVNKPDPWGNSLANDELRAPDS